MCSTVLMHLKLCKWVRVPRLEYRVMLPNICSGGGGFPRSWGFGENVRPVIPLLHFFFLKRPLTFCQKWSGRLNLNTHAPLTNKVRVGWLCCCPGSEPQMARNEPTCNLSGNILPQSSQLTEQLWTDPVTESGICVCKLSPLKKKKIKCS